MSESTIKLNDAMLTQIDNALQGIRDAVQVIMATNEAIQQETQTSQYDSPFWFIDGESDPIKIPDIERRVQHFVEMMLRREMPTVRFENEVCNEYLDAEGIFSAKDYAAHLRTKYADVEGTTLRQMLKGAFATIPCLGPNRWYRIHPQTEDEWPMHGKKTLVFTIDTDEDALSDLLSHIQVTTGKKVKPPEAVNYPFRIRHYDRQAFTEYPDIENIEHVKYYRNGKAEIKFKTEADALEYRALLFKLWKEQGGK